MQVKSIAMLQREHSAKLSTFIKLPFLIKTLVLSIFEWPLKTGFTVFLILKNAFVLKNTKIQDEMRVCIVFFSSTIFGDSYPN